MESTVVVIGREPIEASIGPIAVGDHVRLPLIEALQLTQASKVTLADWREQQAPAPQQPSVVTRVMEAVEQVVEAVKKPKRRYRRRDLQAEKS